MVSKMVHLLLLQRPFRRKEQGRRRRRQSVRLCFMHIDVRTVQMQISIPRDPCMTPRGKSRRDRKPVFHLVCSNGCVERERQCRVVFHECHMHRFVHVQTVVLYPHCKDWRFLEHRFFQTPSVMIVRESVPHGSTVCTIVCAVLLQVLQACFLRTTQGGDLFSSLYGVHHLRRRRQFAIHPVIE